MTVRDSFCLTRDYVSLNIHKHIFNSNTLIKIFAFGCISEEMLDLFILAHIDWFTLITEDMFIPLAPPSRKHDK